MDVLEEIVYMYESKDCEGFEQWKWIDMFDFTILLLYHSQHQYGIFVVYSTQFNFHRMLKVTEYVV